MATIYEFTEASGRKNAINVSLIARIDLDENRIRTFIPNELERYDFKTDQEAKKIYAEIVEIMKNKN